MCSVVRTDNDLPITLILFFKERNLLHTLNYLHCKNKIITGFCKQCPKKSIILRLSSLKISRPVSHLTRGKYIFQIWKHSVGQLDNHSEYQQCKLCNANNKNVSQPHDTTTLATRSILYRFWFSGCKYWNH